MISTCTSARGFKTAVVALGLLVGSTASAGIPVALGDSADGQIPSLAPMLEEATPAVVNISTENELNKEENPLFRDPFFRYFFDMPEEEMPRQRRRSQSLGSGVIIDAEKGYVITNHHVIQKADTVKVTLQDGRSFEAELVGADPETDVALVQIDADDLTAVSFGKASRLDVGDFVVAVGNPFGLNQTVTSGIISALGRTGLGIEGYENFIQTDASINPGNSGGALLNLKGELIGINTAIIGPSGGNVGIGFAIPVDMVRAVVDQLIEYGEVRRGVLGVYIQDLTPELANAFDIKDAQGAVVARVIPDTAAEEAGLKSGDVITAVNDQAIRDAAHLRNVIGLMRVGEEVSLRVVRDGERLKVSATIGQRTGETTAQASPESLDKRLQGAKVTSNPEGNGVQVAEIEQGSPAWQAGLRTDDVIVSVNRQPIANLEAFKRVLGQDPQTLLLHVYRGDSALFLLIR